MALLPQCECGTRRGARQYSGKAVCEACGTEFLCVRVTVTKEKGKQ